MIDILLYVLILALLCGLFAWGAEFLPAPSVPYVRAACGVVFFLGLIYIIFNFVHVHHSVVP